MASPDPAAVASCNSDSKVTESGSPSSPESPVLSALSYGCFFRQLFLLSPKPAVHKVDDIILYGQWPRQGQSVLKCKMSDSVRDPSP